MQNIAAAVTMVRDDTVFLAAWLRHYGAILGRENCTVINHGRGDAVARMAHGCNLIGLPGDPHPNFEMKRWRMLNNVVQALRPYYTHVIVGDVDELVVLDPAQGGLLDFLARTRGNRVVTPVGLEVIHRRAIEPAPIDDSVLGPRMHVRPAPDYSKPCILSTGTKIARGGHFTQHDRLETQEGLYLLHLKYADFDSYVAAQDRRNAMTAALGVGPRETTVGRHWFAQARGQDSAAFDAFDALPLEEGFDTGWLREAMHATWRKRGDTGFWQFDRPEAAVQYRLPERFAGLF
ncbi:glycosyltransferase family 2 protein [Citreimonas sp.]|uniref:glycosyltransferase family 2 protein n=1 Tax=Citreimonas sp. TaxID=3036715 RepID=UPI004059FBBA